MLVLATLRAQRELHGESTPTQDPLGRRDGNREIFAGAVSRCVRAMAGLSAAATLTIDVRTSFI